jgi:hypothetical protein
MGKVDHGGRIMESNHGGRREGVAILQIAQIDSVELVYALATEVKKWYGS